MLRRLHVRATPNHSLLTNNCLQVYYALAYDNDTNPTTPSSLYHQSFNNTRLHGPWKEPKRRYNHSGSFFHPLLLRWLKTHILSRFFFFLSTLLSQVVSQMRLWVFFFPIIYYKGSRRMSWALFNFFFTLVPRDTDATRLRLFFKLEY